MSAPTDDLAAARGAALACLISLGLWALVLGGLGLYRWLH